MRINNLKAKFSSRWLACLQFLLLCLVFPFIPPNFILFSCFIFYFFYCLVESNWHAFPFSLHFPARFAFKLQLKPKPDWIFGALWLCGISLNFETRGSTPGSMQKIWYFFRGRGKWEGNLKKGLGSKNIKLKLIDGNSIVYFTRFCIIFIDFIYFYWLFNWSAPLGGDEKHLISRQNTYFPVVCLIFLILSDFELSSKCRCSSSSPIMMRLLTHARERDNSWTKERDG